MCCVFNTNNPGLDAKYCVGTFCSATGGGGHSASWRYISASDTQQRWLCLLARGCQSVIVGFIAGNLEAQGVLPNTYRFVFVFPLVVSRCMRLLFIRVTDIVFKFVFPEGAHECCCPISSFEFVALVRVSGFNKWSPFLCNSSFQEVIPSHPILDCAW
jgi:hypothetical protein